MNWKDVERIVGQIYEKLGTADTVQLDVRRKGRRSEQLRQIDVLVTSRAAGHPLEIAIECKKHRRPIDVKTVDEFESFLDDVNVDMGVLVSASGFTSAAKTSASSRRIRLLTFAELSSNEWGDILGCRVMDIWFSTKYLFPISWSPQLAWELAEPPLPAKAMPDVLLPRLSNIELHGFPDGVARTAHVLLNAAWSQNWQHWGSGMRDVTLRFASRVFVHLRVTTPGSSSPSESICRAPVKWLNYHVAVSHEFRGRRTLASAYELTDAHVGGTHGLHWEATPTASLDTSLPVQEFVPRFDRPPMGSATLIGFRPLLDTESSETVDFAVLGISIEERASDDAMMEAVEQTSVGGK